MTYLEARRVEMLFREYRKLTLDYWDALIAAPESPHAWMAGPGGLQPTETDSSREIRRKLKLIQPEVVHWANRLGVSVTGQSFPAPAVGGPVIPFNFLECVTDQNIGHTTVPTARVLDAIDKCIGAAGFDHWVGWSAYPAPVGLILSLLSTTMKSSVPGCLPESPGGQDSDRRTCRYRLLL